MKILAAIATCLLAATTSSCGPSAYGSCGADTISAFKPLTQGPLALNSVTCSASEGLKWSVSPDGKVLAAFGSSVDFTNLRDGVTKSSTVINIYADGTASKWSADSRSLWLPQGQRQSASHAVSVSFHPVRLAISGGLTALPQIMPRAGEVDSLSFIDANGLAVVSFNEAQSTPVFGIADTMTGKVRSQISVADTWHTLALKMADQAGMSTYAAAGIVMPDGRARILFNVVRINRWIIWTEGETPRLLVPPHPLGWQPDGQIALSPDGKSVLVHWPLSAGGVYREGPHSGYTPGSPAEGPLVSLVSLKDGRELWVIHARTTSDHPRIIAPPAIRTDGRYALIGIPANDGPPAVALLSMTDGRIIQKLPASDQLGQNFNGMGFTDTGVWLHGYQRTAIYRFK